MRILLLNLPSYLPTIMPYSVTMMQSVLSSQIDEIIIPLDLNAKYHRYKFKEFYDALANEEYFRLLTRFVNEARHVYGKISKTTLSGMLPEGHDFLMGLILEKKPDFICISQTYNSQTFFAKGIIANLPKRIKVILGGPGDFSKIKGDSLVLNNYDELAKHLVHLGAKSKSSDAALDFSEYDKNDYFTREIVYPLRTASSCPYKKCAFCTHHANMPYHEIDLYFIRDTIIRNKTEKICFIDDCFTVQRLNALIDILRPLEVTWWCQLRPTAEIIKILPKLYNSGLRSVAWGIESGSQRMLNLMLKGTKTSKNAEILKKSKMCGIINMVYVMFGFPGETEKEFMETIDFLKQNKENIDLVSDSVFGLQQGSPAYENPDKFGILNIMHRDRIMLGNQITYVSNSGLSQQDAKALKKQYLPDNKKINKIPKVINACKEQVLNYP
ncbi:MAG: radical SAM protein [archaeon]